MMARHRKKNNPRNQFLSFILFFIIIVGGQLSAQTAYVLTSAQQFKVSGTSTLHDWDMVSDNGEGSAKISYDDYIITNIQLLKVILPAVSLKSGTESMDDNAYKALDTKQYPDIRFDFTDIQNITSEVITVKGKVTISGTTQIVPIDINYKISDNIILFTGDLNITFSQFKIDPPKALLGTIKTGNELKISFETTFKSIN